MKRLLCVFLFGLFAHAQSIPEVKDWNSLSIKLERGACLGTCAVYSVEILGRGEILYQGRSGVTVLGTHADRVSREELETLLDEFRAAEFLALGGYEPGAQQGGLASTLTLQVDGRARSVVTVVGRTILPPRLTELHSLVDFYGHTTQWVFGDPRTVDGLRGERLDFRSQEAGAMLARAAYQADAEAVRGLIAAGAPLEVAGASLCDVPLVCSVHNHNIEVLRMLIAAGASKGDAKAKAVALGEAIRRENREAERLLREYGARGFVDVKDWSSVKIFLDKTSCFGSCADYQVEIKGDGDVSYFGRHGVNTQGTQKRSIAKDAVQGLVERFASADFFALARDERKPVVFDAQIVTLQIEVDGVSAGLAWFDPDRVPRKILDLVADVDQVAGTAAWVGRR